ncbi:hypothetical protein HN415_07125, partial [Candidatus Woesearchaeota archaeon]|nr:hypothetical protein [Candidatus Woesearchaeota archaeon]
MELRKIINNFFFYNLFVKNKFIFLIIFIHFLLINFTLPIVDVFNDKILITDDYPYKYFEVKKLKESIINFEFYYCDEITGFYTKFSTSSEKIIVLISLLFYFISVNFIFKFTIFLEILILPLFIYFSSRNFGLNNFSSKISIVLSIFIIHFDLVVHAFIYVGIISYLLSIFISIYAISYFYKYYNKLNLLIIIKFLVICFISIFLHVFGIITILISVSVIILFFIIKEFKLKYNFINFIKLKYKYYFIILITFILFILFIFSLFTFVFRMQPAEMQLDQNNGFETLFFDFQHNPLKMIILFFGFLSLLFLLKDTNFNSFSFFFISIVAILFFIGYFGSILNFFQYLKPYRLSIVLILFLIFPIAKYLDIFIKSKMKMKGKVVLIIIIYLLIFIYFSLAMSNMFHTSLGTGWGQKISTEIPNDTKLLLNWIIKETNNDSLILIEGSSNLDYRYNHVYGGHVSVLFNEFTNRSFITYSDHTHERLINPKLYLKDGKINLKDLNKEFNYFNKLIRKKHINLIVV